MGDFDETKHLRDSNGRFTSGAAGFVAKHTGKLEGYGGKGEPGAGRLEHDLTKEISPLAKWVASKHSIDLDLIKANKNDRNPSTGELDASNSFRGTDFIEKEMGRLTMQKEALVKESRKAEVSRVGYQNKVASAKYALEDVTPAHGDEEKDRERRAEAKKVLDKGAERKEKEAAARRDEAHEKLGHVLAQWRSANEAHEVMLRIEKAAQDKTRQTEPGKGDENFPGDAARGIPGRAWDDKSDYRYSVSHDRSGNWEINVRGETRTEGHPGEKSMVYKVEKGQPPKIKNIDKKKNISFGDRADTSIGSAIKAMTDKEKAPAHTMTMVFPSHKDTGASHPLEGETRGTSRHTDAPNVSNFFHESDVSK